MTPEVLIAPARYVEVQQQTQLSLLRARIMMVGIIYGKSAF
ncbi:hypothetical protein [Phyllobacterium zundukense]|nr:hypothetical protein [Phyllobacterium zundukense]